MLLVCRTLVVLCLLATITSTLRVYPHQLAYFNEAAGGPENGYKHLLHSNLDWGQDLLLAREWIEYNGIDSANVKWVSYGALKHRELLLTRSQQTSRKVTGVHSNAPDLQWKVISSNRFFAPSAWHGGCVVRRIGYTLWLIPAQT